ncbi:MAG: PhnD/SsuA/transferrin family substrate-binding protein [Ignavibacteriales bacterium]|nr:PhnD/SsuA/transferrin family substrate-binding protein [Ignavibacteriales bacterium]
MIYNIIRYRAILLLLGVLFGHNISYSQKYDDHVYRLVISSSMFQNTKPEDVEASTKILAAELNKSGNIIAEFEISVCVNENELLDSLKSQFDILYISPIEYLKLKKKFSIQPSLVSEIDKNYGDIYYLITNQKENKKTLKEIKNGIIYILSNSEGQAPSLWLDKILKDSNLPSKKKFFKQVLYDFKTTNVVLPVFFNKADAAIVTESAFNLICELNPKIKNEAIIVLKSKPFPNALFCFDGRNKDDERKSFLLKYLQELHKNNYGKQVLTLYMVDRLIPFKQEYLDNILELYK